MITIHIQDDALEARLRHRAALNGREVEDEARALLAETARGITASELLARSAELFGPDNGVDIESARRVADWPSTRFEW